MKTFLKRYLPQVILSRLVLLYRGGRRIFFDFRALLHSNIEICGNQFMRPFLAGVVVRGHVQIGELWMAEFLKYFSLRNSVFVDVGANIGQTLLSIKAAHPHIEYIGFEPNSACVFYIQNLIKKNKFTRSTVISAGLSNENGIKNLWVTKGRPVSSGSTLNTKVKVVTDKNASAIVVLRLDDVWSHISRGCKLGFFKIDTEGYEPQVLRGAMDVLHKYQPFLLVEWLPPRTDQGEEHQERLDIRASLQQIVDELKYTIFRIVTSDEGHFVGISQISSFPCTTARVGDAHYCQDYFLAPSVNAPPSKIPRIKNREE